MNDGARHTIGDWTKTHGDGFGGLVEASMDRVERRGLTFATWLVLLAGSSIAAIGAAGQTTPTIELSVESTTLSEDADDFNVRLTLANPPAGMEGKYTGCRVRLAAGSGADAADVEFKNQKKLRATNSMPWSAEAKFVQIVDDAVEEGTEVLRIEGYCTGSKGVEPPHDELLSTPLALTIGDNDQYVTLALSPDEVDETLGEQSVTVTGSVRTAPTATSRSR